MKIFPTFDTDAISFFKPPGDDYRGAGNLFPALLIISQCF